MKDKEPVAVVEQKPKQPIFIQEDDPSGSDDNSATPKDELKEEADDYDFTAQIYYKEREIE
jgi:hypothetical protein